jgi:hypothetical protein
MSRTAGCLVQPESLSDADADAIAGAPHTGQADAAALLVCLQYRQVKASAPAAGLLALGRRIDPFWSPSS